MPTRKLRLLIAQFALGTWVGWWSAVADAAPGLTCQTLLQQGLGVLEQELLVEGMAEVEGPSRDLRFHFDLIHRMASELRSRNITARRVFYPAAGYDAATPTVLFPDAVEIVVVDIAPFHRSGDPVVQAVEGGQQGISFIVMGDVLEANSVAGSLLARLSLAVPGFRLRSVQGWRDSRKIWGTRVRNGVIEYDTGNGTELRRLVYIHDKIESLESNWGCLLRQNNYDAVIAKGLDLNGMMSASMRSEIFEELRRNRGVLVEDSRHFTFDVLPNGAIREDLDLCFGHGNGSLVRFLDERVNIPRPPFNHLK